MNSRFAPLPNTDQLNSQRSQIDLKTLSSTQRHEGKWVQTLHEILWVLASVNILLVPCVSSKNMGRCGVLGGGSSLPSAVTQTHRMRETQRSAIYPWNSEELGHPLHSPQSFHTSQHSNDCVFACVYSLIHLKSPLCVSCVPSTYVYPSEPVRKSCFAGLVLPYVVRRHHFRVSYGQELILHCSDEGQLLRPLPARVQFFMDDLTPITTQANKGGAGWWCGGVQIRALSAGYAHQFQTWTMCQTLSQLWVSWAILGQAGGLWNMHLYALSGTRHACQSIWVHSSVMVFKTESETSLFGSKKVSIFPLDIQKHWLHLLLTIVFIISEKLEQKD